RQQQIAVLDDRILHRTLYLGSQAAFAVEALMLLRALPCMADQPAEGVVAIVAEGFAQQWHGDASKVQCAFDQYWRFRHGWELAELIGRNPWILE
ncbi:hypothetical protein, partial [Pseudomonas sp. GM60]|uniref:hypothetical protein n=1 Tax=Pseudomonas sp. GM60 TaxID=1144334 RepID=UPI0012F9E78E